MTADEILNLVADYDTARDVSMPNGDSAHSALYEVIHQVVRERDEALLRNVEMGIFWVASETDDQAAMAELRIERDAILAECERMRAERNL